MAVVQLSDVIQPEFFAQYSAENSMTSTALFRSGVLVPNPLMRAQLGDGGDTLNIPFWLDLVSPADPSGVDPNVSTDNPSDLSTPFEISALNQVVRKSYLNNSWAAAAFAGELAGSDPMAGGPVIQSARGLCACLPTQAASTAAWMGHPPSSDHEDSRTWPGHLPSRSLKTDSRSRN